MTPASQNPHSNVQAAPPAGGISLDDVLFTVFRHKWLILAFFFAGVLGAVTVRILRPPYFVTEAKLLIPFVLDKPPGPEAGDTVVNRSDGGSVLNTEIEILWSHDVISNAVRMVGPERILAKKKHGKDPDTAAAVLAAGLEVEQPPKTQILRISFRNRDPDIIQPVLESVLENYMMAHVQSHIGADSEWSRQKKAELKKRLLENEEQQKQLMSTNQVLNLDTSIQSFQIQLDKAHTDLYEAERDLAGRRAMLGDITKPDSGPGNAVKGRVPPEILEEYGILLNDINEWKRKDREFALQGYTPAHPLRSPIKGQIDKLSQQKTNLLARYAALAQFNMAIGSTNSGSGGLAVDLAEIAKLSGTVEYCRTTLSNFQSKVDALLNLKKTLHDLQRQHGADETNYNFIAQNLELETANRAMGAGNLINITTIEKPTPPARDTKKLNKLLTTVFAGCVACGLGLAFLIDFVLDRSIKRRGDVERHLHLRVLQTIPDTTWGWQAQLPWGSLIAKRKAQRALVETGANGIALWDPVHQLFEHSDGLRERLMTWFEVQNMTLKKPKMVGITSCNRGSGVTTIASGLAASLSKTGNGNVLLVSMNTSGQEAGTQSFHNGEPGSGLAEHLQTNGEGEHQLEENLYVAPANGEAKDKLVPAQASRLNFLIPQLKASEYDYIVFDMPRVSQTSSTARMAGYMDIVLLVLESEKTAQQAAVTANAMMKESRANVAAVLNKYRPRVPALLSPEL